MARIARTASVVIVACVVLLAPAAAPAADYGFTHAAGSPFTNDSDPLDVIVADIDADGFPDAVLGDQFGSLISIFWGQAGGTFNPTPLELSTSGAATHVVVTQLDGDADLDIAGAGGSFQSFFKNNGARTFAAGPAQSVDTGDDFTPAAGMVAADFDQDGDNDIAMSVFIASSGGANGGAVRLLRNGSTTPGPPAGTFTFEPDIVDEEDYVGDIVVGNFNADNDPDLAYVYVVDNVFVGDPFIGVQLGAANRTFGARSNIDVDVGSDLAVHDLDNDDELDLVSDGSTVVHWGNGNGTFDPPDEVSPEDGIGFFFGDFNDDGLDDIGLDGDPVQLLTNKGAKTFALGGEFASSEFGYHGAAVDLDADPRDDLVLGGFFEMVVLRTGDPPPPPPPPPDGGGTTPPPGGTTPPAGGTRPPMTVPPGNQPPGTVVPVTAGQLATLPSARRRPCGSRRNFRIRLRRPPAGVTVREARVLVNGKRVKVVRGARLTAPVDLRGFPRGRAVVTIRITLGDGRVLRGRRVYRPCATKKRQGRFGRRRG